jgi:hypothetical protein
MKNHKIFTGNANIYCWVKNGIFGKILLFFTQNTCSYRPIRTYDLGKK